MASRPTPLTFMDMSVSPPVSRTFASSIIFFAGKSGSVFYNDVWASSDKGTSWYLISGTANGTTAGNGLVLRDNSRSADCFDYITGRMYLIGGTNATVSKQTTHHAAAAVQLASCLCCRCLIQCLGCSVLSSSTFDC